MKVYSRGPKDLINIRILHSGSKAQYGGDNRNHVLQGVFVYVVSGGAHVQHPQIGFLVGLRILQHGMNLETSVVSDLVDFLRFMSSQTSGWNF